MTPRITNIRLTDFRSISGTVDLDLDAPVVLIHGPNGSGKTSLLSAIELGLTGEVASLRRFDTAYAENLVHYDAREASVSIACRHPEIGGEAAKLTLQNGKISGEPLLTPSLRRFYTERSFLAQATLGRLLEIYENSDTRDEQSPLTRFVKDLLGLDAIDDIINGLHPVGDKRRIRRSLPLYADAENHCERLEKEVSRLSALAQEYSANVDEEKSVLSASLEPFSFPQEIELDNLIGILRYSLDEEATAVSLGTLRREIVSALSLSDKLDNPNAEAMRSEVEAALSEARNAYAAWRESAGTYVDAALQVAGELIKNLPNARRVGRLAACEAAFNDIIAERKRAIAIFEQDQVARSGRDKSQSDLDKAKVRGERLDQQLERLSEQSSELAQALSELTPYIDGDVCPVCQRDFSEVSNNISLHEHLSAHVARLSQTAGQLQNLTFERREIRKIIVEAERAIELHSANILDRATRTAFLKRSVDLEEASNKLELVIPLANEGDELAETVERVSNQLNKLRQDEESWAGLRASVSEYPVRLEIEGALEEESIRATLERCLSVATERLAAFRTREAQRQSALTSAERLKQTTDNLMEIEQELGAAKLEAKNAKDALAAADALRRDAKTLSDRAIQVRTDIVRKVFNKSLNQIWKDLFIRLAPEEPFIPAFALPQSAKGPVEAHLETRYRGEVGGNPKAMLSAGNLNTAALTLFLSLHLSVEPLLPWLVIDDPVQSMDEIHIAQFAALLRTLSKQHNRQIIIAVHEKPLFNYLALELSPASEGDRLITVELFRTSSGKTDYAPNFETWNPDRVFRAVG